MRSKLVIVLSAGLAIMLGCVQTTSVEAPSDVNPNVSFEVTVNTELTQGSYGDGNLAILIPEIWSVDSVYCDGYQYTGPFSVPDTVFFGWANDSFPPNAGYEWWYSSSPATLSGDSGETGHVTVTITTSDSIGTFKLAFIAFSTYEHQPYYDGVPCSCTVEVTPLSLEQETWAHIKSEF